MGSGTRLASEVCVWTLRLASPAIAALVNLRKARRPNTPISSCISLKTAVLEFGRRPRENQSGGTDHGVAAPMFLFGSRVKEGIHGKHPSLTDLDQGDLKHAIDFRSVYATVLQNWLDVASKPILGQQFDLLPILKG